MSCGDRFNHCQQSLGSGTPADMPITTSSQQQCPTCGGFLRADGGCTKCEVKQSGGFSEDRVFDTGLQSAQPIKAVRLHECLDRARNMVVHLASGPSNPSAWVADAEEVLAKDGGVYNNVDPKVQADLEALSSNLRRAHEIIYEGINTLMSGRDAPDLRKKASEFLEYHQRRTEPVDELARWKNAFQPRLDKDGLPILHSWDDVKSLDPDYVWSLTEEDDIEAVAPGFHHINNLGFYVCDKPADTDTAPVQITDPEEYLDRVVSDVVYDAEMAISGEWDVDEDGLEVMADNLRRAIEMNDSVDSPRLRAARTLLDDVEGGLAEEWDIYDSDGWQAMVDTVMSPPD